MIVPNTPLEVLLTITDDGRPDGYKRRMPVIALDDDMTPFIAVPEDMSKQYGPGIRPAHEIGKVESVHPVHKPAKFVQFAPVAGEYVAITEVVDGLFRTEPVLGQFINDDGSAEPVVAAHDGTFISAHLMDVDIVVPLCSGHEGSVETMLFDGRKIRVSTDGLGGEPTVVLV